MKPSTKLNHVKRPTSWEKGTKSQRPGKPPTRNAELYKRAGGGYEWRLNKSGLAEARAELTERLLALETKMKDQCMKHYGFLGELIEGLDSIQAFAAQIKTINDKT